MTNNAFYKLKCFPLNLRFNTLYIHTIFRDTYNLEALKLDDALCP